MREQKSAVDLARARLVPAGVVGDLKVRDAPDVLSDVDRQIPFHHLRVIDVELQPQIGGGDLFHHRQGVLAGRHEEPAHVAVVDRLQQQADAGALQRVGGELQVGDQRGLGDLAADIDRDPGQTVELPATQRRRGTRNCNASPTFEQRQPEAHGFRSVGLFILYDQNND